MSTRVAIGAMRDRIVIEAAVTADDGMGGRTVTKHTTVAEAWAAVTMRGTGETIAAEQMTATAAVSVVTRWRSDLSTTHRLLWRGRTLQIRNIVEDSHKRHITLHCSEVQA